MTLRRPIALSVLILVVVTILLVAWRYRAILQPAPATAQTLAVDAGCDSAHTACVARVETLAIEIGLGPSVRPMQPFNIRLRTVLGRLSDSAQVELQFQMRGMDMGLNRYRLVAGDTGVWHGQAILPVCSQGRSDWIAQLEIHDGGRHWAATLPFTTD